MTKEQLLELLDASTEGLDLDVRLRLEVLLSMAQELAGVKAELARLAALIEGWR